MRLRTALMASPPPLPAVFPPALPLPTEPSGKAHLRLLVSSSFFPSQGLAGPLGPAGGWSPLAAGLYFDQEGLWVSHVSWKGLCLEREGPE